jgi:AraC-like DNA-binding protein
MLEHRAIYPASELFLIKQFMQKEGFDASQWLFGSGLQAKEIKQADLLVSLHQFDLIYRNVFRLIQGPDAGFRFGDALNLSRWGVLTSALSCARTLGAALQVANDHRLLIRSRFNLIPERVGDDVSIHITSKTNLSFPINEAFAFEMLLASLKRQISDLLGKSFSFSKIQLHYPAPKNRRTYEENCLCPVEFSRSSSHLWLPVSALTQALPLANEITHRQALAVCEQDKKRIDNVQAGDVVWLVRAELAKAAYALPTLDALAAQIAVGPRTLRRQLKAAGTCYSALYQEHQLGIALQALSNTELSLSEIAYQCGFSHTASFSNAFFRWMKQSPKQYRQEIIELKNRR